MAPRVRFLWMAVLAIAAIGASGQTFTATLSGAAEVPGPGDPDGSGSATISISGTTVNYSVNVSGIALPPTAAHIHVGAAGVAGAPVVTLSGTWSGGTLNGSTVSDAATVAAIVGDPAGFYVNVHTTEYPGGAVRGQLALVPGSIPTLSPGLLALLAVALAGAAVVALRQL